MSAKIGRIIVLFCVVVLLAPLPFTYIKIFREKLPDNVTPAENGLTFEPVEFRSDGMALRGWYIPSPEDRGTFVTFHGVGANMEDILPEAGVLRSAGFNVLMFDFRGHGNSDGNHTTYGVDEKTDALAAINFARKLDADKHQPQPAQDPAPATPEPVTKPPVAPAPAAGENQASDDKPAQSEPPRKRPFGIFGVSMGAAIAMMAVANTPGIDAVIIESPFADFWELAVAEFAKIYGPAGVILQEIGRVYAILLVGADFKTLKPIDDINRMNPAQSPPALFIIGEKDTIVPPDQTIRLYDAYKGPKTLIKFPTANHREMYIFDRGLYETSVDIFLDTVFPREEILEPDFPADPDSPAAQVVEPAATPAEPVPHG